jgi:hypothetical protein
MNDPVLDAQRRSARYWNVDGLSELAVGLQVLLVPLFLYGVAGTSRGSAGRVAVVLGLAAGLPLAAFLSSRVIIAIRKRFTYPRTGFVAYRPATAQPWVFGTALAVGLLVLFLALRGLTANWVAWLFVVQGIVPGSLLVYFGRLVGLPRFEAIGAIYAVVGVALAVANPGLIRGMTIFWAAMGLVFILSGTWTLLRYYRAHPHAAEVL